MPVLPFEASLGLCPRLLEVALYAMDGAVFAVQLYYFMAACFGV
jgi:hypothetical protein